MGGGGGLNIIVIRCVNSVKGSLSWGPLHHSNRLPMFGTLIVASYSYDMTLPSHKILGDSLYICVFSSYMYTHGQCQATLVCADTMIIVVEGSDSDSDFLFIKFNKERVLTELKFKNFILQGL